MPDTQDNPHSACRTTLGERTKRVFGMSEANHELEMEEEYDFTGAERGKFYKPGMKLCFPVYLDEAVQTYLTAAAERKGTSLSQLVNDILSREIEIAEVIK